MVLYENFITEKGLQNLEEYKFSKSGMTPLEEAIDPFQNGLTECQPRNLAPNMITFMAQSSLIVSGFIFLIIDPSVSNGYPKILYLIGAFGLFLFHLLDILDGKQARRLGASSPIGQLLDHGMDSYTLFYMTLLGCSTDGQGNQVHILWVMIQISTIVDYLSNWMEHHSRIFQTSAGPVGPTEIFLLLIFAFIFNYVTGVGLAEIPIFQGLTVGSLIFYAFIFIVPFQFYYAWKCTAPYITDVKKALLRFLPLVMLLVSSVILSSIEEFNSFKGWVVIGYGAFASLIQCKIIVSTMTSLEFQVLHFELVYLLILSLLAKLCSDPSLKRLICLLIILGGHFFQFGFGTDLVLRIAKKFKINVFTVTPKEEN